MDTGPESHVESMLDALGKRERDLPDAGFETRIAAGAAHTASSQRRRPGRRRLLIAPAALAGIAAVIGIAIVLLPATPALPAGGETTEGASIAELSFTLFDATFGLDTAFTDSSDETMVVDPTSLDDWFAEGDAL